MKDLIVVVAFEGWVSTEKDEEIDTETPDIARLVIVAIEYFWGDIEGGTDDAVHLLNLSMLVKALRAAEINHFNLRVIRGVLHEEVLRLQIPVNDA